MSIPIRNTVRSASIKSNFSTSILTTPSGATISGEIRQYNTYKEMVSDIAPARLASVVNASMDKDYPVPEEHRGGILYQHDNVNDAWILLYSTEDLTVPTRINWPNIVNVPKWVGGISFNRVKLTENRIAETRTTYFSYGDYILVLPDPNTVELGDQIALEQYKGQGAICYPYTNSETNQYLEDIVSSTDPEGKVLSFKLSTLEINGLGNRTYGDYPLQFNLQDEAQEGNERIYVASIPDSEAICYFKYDELYDRWAMCLGFIETNDIADTDNGYATLWQNTTGCTDPWDTSEYIFPDDSFGNDYIPGDTDLEFNSDTPIVISVSDLGGEGDDLYHVEYTYADYAFTRDAEGHMVIDTSKPIDHHNYLFTCTENSFGERIWRMTGNTNIEDSIVDMRKEFFKHLWDRDPHHQYLRKSEVGTYISSLIEITYRLPEASLYNLGGVYEATPGDVVSSIAGPRAVTAKVLNTVLSDYAVVDHNHSISGLVDYNSTTTLTNHQVLMYDANTGLWTPTTFTSSGIAYGPPTSNSAGVVYQAKSNYINEADADLYPNHYVNVPVLASTLVNYRLKTENVNIDEIDGLDITTAGTGDVLIVTVNGIEASSLRATSDAAGIIQIANDTEIVYGTTVVNKAVNPVQLVSVSSAILSKVTDMIMNSGYVLPDATFYNLGGVRLIGDATLSLVVNDYPDFSSHSVASATVINPMQFASYYAGLSTNIVSMNNSMFNEFNTSYVGRFNNLTQSCAVANANATSAINTAQSGSNTITSKFNQMASTALTADWIQFTDITASTLRISSSDGNAYTVPTQGFIKFYSVPDTTDYLFSAAIGANGRFVARGFVDGDDNMVHYACGKIGDGAYDNLNINVVPVQQGDLVWYEVIANSGTNSSAYLNFAGFKVVFVPAKAY